MPTIRLKRIYDDVEPTDGARILVDRLWPRGISKDVAELTLWAKSVSPSNELRKWYKHDEQNWDEFVRQYFAELDANPDGIAELNAAIKDAGKQGVTFLFGSKELERNNATALLQYLSQ